MKTLSRLGKMLAFALVASCATEPPSAPQVAVRALASVGACTRFARGSKVEQPPDLFSQDGVLRVSLSYQANPDEHGQMQYCYKMANGEQSPTLHIYPGERILLTLTNNTPIATAAHHMARMAGGAEACAAAAMDGSSTNIHFHGLNAPPVCHQDEVLHTFVNSGQSFTYDLHVPKDQPPGLYWYHPHIHGATEATLFGGASGAIVVEGLQNVVARTAGLRQQILIVRDNPVPGNPKPSVAGNRRRIRRQPAATEGKPGGKTPSWDLSLNNVPIAYPDYKLAQLAFFPGEKRLWRMVNASADSMLDLQVLYDGVAQPLEVVGLDGVPIGSQHGTRTGNVLTKNHIRLPPAARAEWIVTGPGTQVKDARLVTLAVDTGPDGDSNPRRPLANLSASLYAALPPVTLPVSRAPAGKQRFEGLTDDANVPERKLYFSEVISNPADPASQTDFFITVDGQQRAMFNPAAGPGVVTKAGSVEDWTIENRSGETHVFHIHQLHFLLIERDGKPVATEDRQFLDIVEVPYWKGTGPYPNVRVRMDFRGTDPGDFVYHCHLVGHEDHGMMGVIRVQPRDAAVSKPK